MGKRIRYESAVYHFAKAVQRHETRLGRPFATAFFQHIKLSYSSPAGLQISSDRFDPPIQATLRGVPLYQRGDTPTHRKRQLESDRLFESADPNTASVEAFFDDLVAQVHAAMDRHALENPSTSQRPSP
ncbi:MAG: hypothetical protein AAF958_18825 [Planctomycetota bacterium]